MIKDILNYLITDFSVDKLEQFFRQRINSFKTDEEDYAYLFEDNENIADNYKSIVKIGKADLLNSDDLLVITAKTLAKLTNKTGKKRQFEIAKKILKEENKDAAFFIFYDDNGNFRFSLIRANFLGAKREFTDFKRYTYFVSKELTNKTFISQISKTDFNDLDSIQEAFSVEPITKQFYEKLQYWYFWAIDNVKFPDDAEQEPNGREVAIIRLITRLMFIWFMKVRNLIPDELFDADNINNILKDFSPEKPTYYRAILQNMFFATLNTKQNERRFLSEIRGHKGYNPDFGNPNVFRYHDLFQDNKSLKTLFSKIPFLNGGLFECLDYKTKKKDDRKYIDGFTATKKQQPIIPNSLFFSDTQQVDLSSFFGKKNKICKVQGLINLLKSYNFTIDENEPDDIEVALDPELLGSVFENLLASYNPETSTTARKATGSFYTPREIVNYMTSESLKQYFTTSLSSNITGLDNKLTSLISANSLENPFDQETTHKIIILINDLRVVDPAVGSGAFPMAILNKLVFILGKLDPDNTFWEESQINGIKKSISDPVLQRKFIEQINRQFKGKNADYGRKLYLIEKCIYGVDIQQIAVEIAKLRFFISLLVDEKINIDEPENNYGIEPLPNLDFKLMQGNSLISTFAGIDFNTTEKPTENSLFDIDDPYKPLIKDFEELKNEYQNEADNENKKQLRNKIEEIILKIFQEKINQHIPHLKAIENKAKQIPKKEQRKEYIIKEKQKLTRKLGFDIEQVEKDLIAYTQGQKPKDFFLWDIYFAEVFSQKDGFDIVIGNPPYIKEYTDKSAFDGNKDKECYQGKMDIWYLFGCKGIDILRKNKGILSFIATNNWITNAGASKFRNKVLKETNIKEFIDFGDFKIFESAGIQTMVMFLQKTKEKKEYLTKYSKILDKNILRSELELFLKKVESTKFEYFGTVINRDAMIDKPIHFLKNEIGSILNKIQSQSNFSFNEKEVANGIHSHHEYVNKKMMPILDNNFNIGDGIFALSNEELLSLGLTEKEKKLIRPYFSTKNFQRYYANSQNTEWLIYTSSKFKNLEEVLPYPNIKNHLDKFKNVITSDNKPYGLHRARDGQFFIGEKIIVQRKCSREPVFTYTDFNCYVSATFYVIKTNRLNQKILTGLLNSKLCAFWLKYKGKMQGDDYQIDKEPLLSIPIKKVTDIKPFEILVNKIITKKETGEDTTSEENQIDLMVYKLYNLTYDEVKIIESEFEMSAEEYENYG